MFFGREEIVIKCDHDIGTIIGSNLYQNKIEDQDKVVDTTCMIQLIKLKKTKPDKNNFISFPCGI